MGFGVGVWVSAGALGRVFFVALHSLPLWKTKSGKRAIMFSLIVVRFSITSFERSRRQCSELLFLVKLFSRICSWMKGKIMFAGCNSGDLSCAFSSPKLGYRSVNLCLQVALAANYHLALADVTNSIRKMG